MKSLFASFSSEKEDSCLGELLAEMGDDAVPGEFGGGKVGILGAISS